MTDIIHDLTTAFARLPGIGPRQARRFVYYLLSVPAAERKRLASLLETLDTNVHQCTSCYRFHNGSDAATCSICADHSRDTTLLMLVEKDQDLDAIERAGTYRGRYFVLGGILTLAGKGTLRERELLEILKMRLAGGLTEVVLALSATSEGEHTADHVRDILAPYRNHLTISLLGRGLATGSELEYSDTETLRSAFTNRKAA